MSRLSGVLKQTKELSSRVNIKCMLKYTRLRVAQYQHWYCGKVPANYNVL